MANTFSIILTLITLFTGIVWLFDKLVLSKKRQQKLAHLKSQVNDLDKATEEKITRKSWLVENCVSIFPVIGIVLILRSFIYEPFQIPSGSMMPTLLVGDFILVEKYAYGLKDPIWRTQIIETGKPKRGDIVVFKYPLNPNIDYIKRVVGLPGDTIIYQSDKRICLQPKGQDSCQLIEVDNLKDSPFAQDGVILTQMTEQLGDVSHQILTNYARSDATNFYKPRANVNQWVVPEGEYFVMGDNRDNSSDSRYWGFVPEADLVGKAVAIWVSFEFDRSSDSFLPAWVPTGIRFNRIGSLH